VKRFRGMFAFALWDRNRQCLFLARDRLGVKPMFYAVLDDGTVLFGSELKALLAHGGLRRDLDPLAVEEYFALGYVAEPRTIFKQARKLPPAHGLVIQRGQPMPAPRRYWDLCASRSTGRCRWTTPVPSSSTGCASRSACA
jgi:asparagine synthase (glutamine-hydrolysing)